MEFQWDFDGICDIYVLIIYLECFWDTYGLFMEVE